MKNNLPQPPITEATLFKWLLRLWALIADIITGFTTLQSDVSTLQSDVSTLQAFFTPDGGLAIPVINRTGGPSVKGYVVAASPEGDTAVLLIKINTPNPVGVIYDADVPDGSLMRIVVSGIADVYYTGSVTRGGLARGFLASETEEYIAGQAKYDALPTAPFATDKHFYEIGHPNESRTGAGLAKTFLHFN